jgi:hypothetical protein
MLPIWMRIRFAKPGERRFTLGFPVIIVWIFVAALMLLLLPFVLIAALATRCRGTGRILLLAYPLLWSVLWSLSGLHIEATNAEADVLIDFR